MTAAAAPTTATGITQPFSAGAAGPAPVSGNVVAGAAVVSAAAGVKQYPVVPSQFPEQQSRPATQTPPSA